MAMPASLIILVCFAAVLILNRIRLPLSLSLFLGGLALGFWSGMVPAAVVSSVLRSVSQWETVYLLIVIILILVISRLMETSGHLQRIVYAFVLVVKDRRAVSALVPALIGVFPVPGGALFSAPLVQKAVGELELPGERKAVINYWFRHVWEYWWPLYPGLILAVSLLGVPVWRVMLVQFPLAVFCVVAGTVFLLRPVKERGRRKGPPLAFESFTTLLWEIVPILLVVGVIALSTLSLRQLQGAGVAIELPREIPVLLGLLLGILWVIKVNKITAAAAAGCFFDRRLLKFIFLVLAVMIFKGVLEASGIVGTIKEELVAYRIPTLLIVAILPLVSGLVTGIAIGFVGASFPVILPLLGDIPPLALLAYAALAYSFGYMGMMLSPVHLCFVVSKDYFKAGFPSSYRLLIKPVILVLFLSMFYAFLLIKIA